MKNFTTFIGCIAIISTLMTPIIKAKNYSEINGQVTIEAEDFSSQHLDNKRRWITVLSQQASHPYADNDQPHHQGSSGIGYIELLPDTRTNHNEKLIVGENFSDKPGTSSILSYPVYFNTPGKYYVWARAYSTGTEDNGIHIGLNGDWPNTSSSLQFCKGKHQWTWSSAQRVKSNHCGTSNTIFFNIKKAGTHTIQLSMREDGFELDKLILTQDPHFIPKGISSSASIKPPTPLTHKKHLHGIKEYDQLLLATHDFTNKHTSPVPFYLHEKQAALAINAAKKEYRNKYAMADHVFKSKKKKSYQLTLITLSEIDGESQYQVLLNGKIIGQFKNAETQTDYKENYFTINKIEVKPDDIITVASMADTNGKIPENNETAYARGRWRAIALTENNR